MTIRENWSTAVKKTPCKGITTDRIDLGNLTIVRYTFEGNVSFPLHRHPEEQTIVVLSGNCTVRTGQENFNILEGDMVHSTSFEPHGITSGGNGVVFLNIITPRRTVDRTEYLETFN